MASASLAGASSSCSTQPFRGSCFGSLHGSSFSCGTDCWREAKSLSESTLRTPNTRTVFIADDPVTRHSENKMETRRRDWIDVVLFATALAPLIMYAFVGAAFMPEVLQAREPPMLITRIITKLAGSTGISFAAATKVAFTAPVVLAAILYGVRDASRRKACQKTEKQAESQSAAR